MLTKAQQKREQDKKNKAKLYWDQILSDGYLQCRVCKDILSLDNFSQCIQLSKKRGYVLYNTECKHCRKTRAFDDNNFNKTSLEDVLHARLSVAIARARSKKIPLNIDLEFLISLWKNQNGKCFYSGRQLSLLINDPNKVSIDRVDSSKGYLKDNVVLCCNLVNYLKVDLSLDYFKEIIIDIYNNFC
jgi:hypothetical protein